MLNQTPQQAVTMVPETIDNTERASDDFKINPNLHPECPQLNARIARWELYIRADHLVAE